MVSLCTNRPEGFGPASKLATPLTTSCFSDVILVPLPVWIYLAALPILFVVTSHQRHSNFNPSTAHLRLHPKRSICRTITTTIYYLLIIATILMQVLEIVRLELIHYGIGLLPFTFVAQLLVFTTHLVANVRRMLEPSMLVGLNTFVWIGLMTMTIVKTVGLGQEYMHGEHRKPSKYPMADQITDCGVSAGLYAVLAVLEILLAVWREKSGKEGMSTDMGEGDSVEVERLGKPHRDAL